MKKYMFLHYGFVTPTAEIGEAWSKWFESIAEHIVDGGNPFSVGREITSDGTTELPLGIDSITGYTIVNAADLNEATELAATCPFITGIRVYEMGAM
jgi:hypothetical protein